MSLPDSSSPTSSDPIHPHASRKRQRSQSMQSDSGASSSSLKRSVAGKSASEVSVRSPRTDQMSVLNQDIDAYMAEQGEADIPSFMSPQNAAPSPPMSPQEKHSFVQSHKSRRMQVGETWYLISRGWYKRWSKACTGEVDKEGPVSEQDLGPVNNSSLLDSYSNLLPSIAEGVDVEYVPQEVWERFVEWYGTPVHPLPRRVIARGAAKLPSIELRPLRLRLFKLVKELSSDTESKPSWITISAGETVTKLSSEIASAIKSESITTGPYRIWSIEAVPEDDNACEFTSTQLNDEHANAKIVDGSDKTLEEVPVESDDAFVVEFKQESGWIVETPKVETPKAVEATAVASNPPPLFNSNEGFFNRLTSSISPPKTTTTTTIAPFKSAGGFFDSFNNSSSVTNKSATKSLEPGTLGLGNMGNTCFMNSALQCLAHTKEITDYFLSGVYEDELNRDNPLGMGGAIAEAFGSLLNRIWATTGTSTSYSPREFKSQLQRFAPQFSGYQQHDSQELVAFLLDGLHEDLNRVLKKPYVEKPDWEGGGDLELIKLAQKSWEGYMMRNDSVIVDLFQGQYQSTLICPECQKVSITFDPFMYLTLPLPIVKKWKHTIYYVPWGLEKPHVKVPVEINNTASFKDLRALLGRWMGATPDNLLTMEIFSHRFYKVLDDSVAVGDMSDADVIVCFELPCNARMSRAYKPQDDDPFILPVLLSDARSPISGYSYGRSSTPQLFGYPVFLVLDREQASDVDAIYEAITLRLQRWTVHSRDLFTWEVDPTAVAVDDQVPINSFPPIESITEITEDGDVVTVQTASPPPEGDIVDEKSMVVDEEAEESRILDEDGALRRVGPKKELFNLRVMANQRDYGAQLNTYATSNRWETWYTRIEEATLEDPALVRSDDALYCEFDEDKRAYFFGDSPRKENTLWNTWETFTHPELEEGKKNNAKKSSKGITLQDCLEEFTKEEQLGEDDLWYCPQCKKHQQATKKFDLWKVPDILVVHLKRFSNNRAMRDKIDALVDFPIEGLDLGDMAGERGIAKKLLEEGVDIEELNIGNLDEPLIYDLFGVDEHLGGLGGGHYRAYTSNHLTGKWYHFDDSYVTPARPTDSVNSNAYLLFYRRRSAKPLGGRLYQKIQEAKETPKIEQQESQEVTIATQLPTPPNEPSDDTDNDRLPFHSRLGSTNNLWRERSTVSNAGSSQPSPPADDPPDFDDFSTDRELPGSHLPMPAFLGGPALSTSYDYPDPTGKASPTSSTEADGDLDLELEQDVNWDMNNLVVRQHGASRSSDSDVSGMASPSYSQFSDSDPFSDMNKQSLPDYDDATMTDYTHDEKTA